MHTEDYMHILYGLMIGALIITGSSLAGCEQGTKSCQKKLYPELCPECQQKIMTHIIEDL